MDYTKFLSSILELHLKYEFSVTSWWRSLKRNKLVGGDPKSKHLQGLAVDIILDTPEDRKGFLKLVKELGLSFLDEGDHIHIQVKK